MSESYDYEPAPYAKAHDFKSAHRAYQATSQRSYAQAVSAGVKHTDLLPKSITTNSNAPILIVADGTGSMAEWPATFFAKFPYLNHEVTTEYFKGLDPQILFGVVGDAHPARGDGNPDNYPTQAYPFTIGEGIGKALTDLKLEKGGGGQLHESYELWALYACRNIQMPQTIVKPVLIMLGDEMPWEVVEPEMAKRIAFVDLEKRMTSKEIFDELLMKFEVFFIQKPYNAVLGRDDNNMGDPVNHQVYEEWCRLLGPDRVYILPAADRVVDVIFGIFARVRKMEAYFQGELEGRQTAAQVKQVYRTLHTTHRLITGAEASGPLLASAAPAPKMLRSGRSRLRGEDDE